MNFPQFVIVMTMFAIPVIAIIGHYIVKLRKLQIDSDQTIVNELAKMNRQIAELKHKIDHVNQPPLPASQQKADKRNADLSQEGDSHRPLLHNQLDRGFDDEPAPQRPRNARFE